MLDRERCTEGGAEAAFVRLGHSALSHPHSPSHLPTKALAPLAGRSAVPHLNFTFLPSRPAQITADDVLDAAKRGDTEELELLLGKAPGLLNCKDKARPFASVVVLRSCRRSGARRAGPHVPSYIGWSMITHDAAAQEAKTPLHWALRHGRALAARALLQRGANVHAKETLVRTPHGACPCPCCDVLSGRQWRLDLTVITLSPFACQNGWTPLHYAVRSGSFELVKSLLESGARTDEKGNVRTPPHSRAQESVDWQFPRIWDLFCVSRGSTVPWESVSSLSLHPSVAGPNQLQKGETPQKLVETHITDPVNKAALLQLLSRVRARPPAAPGMLPAALLLFTGPELRRGHV